MQNFEGFLSYWRLALVKILEDGTISGGVRSKKSPKWGDFMDVESIRKTLQVFKFTTTYAILMKLTTNMYLNWVFYLAQSWSATHRV